MGSSALPEGSKTKIIWILWLYMAEERVIPGAGRCIISSIRVVYLSIPVTHHASPLHVAVTSQETDYTEFSHISLTCKQGTGCSEPGSQPKALIYSVT